MIVHSTNSSTELFMSVFARLDRTRVLALKDALNSVTLCSRSVTEYLTDMKAKFGEIAMIDRPLPDDDITLYISTDSGLLTETLPHPSISVSVLSLLLNFPVHLSLMRRTFANYILTLIL